MNVKNSLLETSVNRKFKLLQLDSNQQPISLKRNKQVFVYELSGCEFKPSCRFSFLFCVIENYSKYAWVIPLKDKKEITITNTVQIILNESKPKPNKIWIDKTSEFYNRSMKSFLQNNDTEIYSTHNEGIYLC